MFKFKNAIVAIALSALAKPAVKLVNEFIHKRGLDVNVDAYDPLTDDKYSDEHIDKEVQEFLADLEKGDVKGALTNLGQAFFGGEPNTYKVKPTENYLVIYSDDHTTQNRAVEGVPYVFNNNVKVAHVYAKDTTPEAIAEAYSQSFNITGEGIEPVYKVIDVIEV